MKNDDELTPAERRELDALPREIAPPGDHEDRTVAALESRGLLGRAERRATLPRMLAAAAVAILLFGGGAAAGRWSALESPPDYILLLRAGNETPLSDPDEGMRRVQEYNSWARSTRGLVAGEKLTDDARFLDSGGTGGRGDREPEDDIQGYFLLRAESYEQAVALAASCPHVKYGGEIEVRRIERFTQETS